eukprot:m.156848 g.156848  ORF g.156848 m.156848 type:complete len:258 (-) comp17951_c0_seq1:206-979(-)
MTTFLLTVAAVCSTSSTLATNYGFTHIRSGPMEDHVDQPFVFGPDGVVVDQVGMVGSTHVTYHQSMATNPPDVLVVEDTEYEISSGFEIVFPKSAVHGVRSFDPLSLRLVEARDSITGIMVGGGSPPPPTTASPTNFPTNSPSPTLMGKMGKSDSAESQSEGMGMGGGKSNSVGSQSMGMGKKAKMGMSQSSESLTAGDMDMSSSTSSSAYMATTAGVCVLVVGVAIVAYRRQQKYAAYTVTAETFSVAANEKAVLL